MRRMKRHNDDGALSRAARGEGKICPRCRTFAPLGADGENRCTICGLSVRKPSGTPTFSKPAAPAYKSGKPVPPPRAPRMIPSSTLGKTRAQPQVQDQGVPKMPAAVVEALSVSPVQVQEEETQVEDETPPEAEEEGKTSSKRSKKWR